MITLELGKFIAVVYTAPDYYYYSPSYTKPQIVKTIRKTAIIIYCKCLNI